MTKTKSELEYYERVKKYVNLKDIRSRSDLEIRLQKAGMLGKVRQYRQLNIVASELDLNIRGKPEDFNSYTSQTYYKGKTSVIRYRDKKTGKFIKKPES